MRHYAAYNQRKQPNLPRIDVIIALYRKALDRLDRAAHLRAEQRSEAIGPLLAEVRLIVASFAVGSAGSTDEAGVCFARLYEFVLHQLDAGVACDITAVRRVLKPLLDGFEAVRDQAATLEMHGQIQPLESQSEVQLTV